MSFFDKKEEVIDLQLTQFGKQLLSLGKFKPAYYAFFDNNILYDSSYSGMSGEAINQIEPRIQDETPYNKTQYVFSGRETAISSFVESNRTRLANQPDSAVLSFENPAESTYTQILPLGNAEPGTQQAPSFSVTFMNGELSGSVTTAYSSSYSIQKIPQLNATIKYSVKPIDFKEIKIPTTKIKYVGFLPQTQTGFKVIQEYLLLQILENNTEFEKDNFEILPYIVETISGSTVSNAISSQYEQLIPIPFEKTIFQEDGVETTNILQTPDFINHFFDILVDEEIPEELICESISRLKKIDYLLDNDYNCDEAQKKLQPVNIYQSNIVDDDIENCEV